MDIKISLFCCILASVANCAVSIVQVGGLSWMRFLQIQKKKPCHFRLFSSRCSEFHPCKTSYQLWMLPAKDLWYQHVTGDITEAPPHVVCGDPPPLKTKGCCSTRCENKCCTDIFKEKNLCLWCWFTKRESRKERTVLSLIFIRCYNSVKYNFQRF